MKKNNFEKKSKEEVIESISMEPSQQLSPEEREKMEEVKSLVEAESLDPTTSMNILINAVQVAFNTDTFNELDRYLIAKSLDCFRSFVEKGEDIVLKVS